tara:strand:- start:475 stop:849 length:375 start_codon:yes stop_codon:yes gene_type:complete
MAVPYSSNPDLPLGLAPATINSVVYNVDDSSLASKVNRLIEQTDGNGDRAAFMIRADAAQIEGTMILQRATLTTVLPPEGTEFTYDFDRSGTASTLVVKDVTVTIGKDNFDTFEITVILKTYQA